MGNASKKACSMKPCKNKVTCSGETICQSCKIAEAEKTKLEEEAAEAAAQKQTAKEMAAKKAAEMAARNIARKAEEDRRTVVSANRTHEPAAGEESRLVSSDGLEYPAAYTEWNNADVQALRTRALQHDKLNSHEAKQLIRALAYKAVHVTEAGSAHAAKFDEKDGSSSLTVVFAQCTGDSKMEEQLYQFYQGLWTEYLTEVVAPATAAPETNAEKLVELSRRYKHFMKILKRVWSFKIFEYLDRFYVPKKNLPTTKLVGYEKWREIIFQGKESGVQEAVLDLIFKDREGEVVDREQLKTVIRIWVDCGLKQVKTTKTAGKADTGPREVVDLEMYQQVRAL